jgi:hypothetical protein
MSKPKSQQYEPVDASPVKSFFVSMLTRDITVEDAILDLLDNCFDGILRSGKSSGSAPYAGFHAEIDFSAESFSIADNCGGIPWALHDYAFRMGRAKDRPSDAPGTVGVYGIGMKRAIFKLGRNCLLSTQSRDANYEVEITADWMADEDKWRIPVRAAKRSMKEDGTTIVVGDLYSGIRSRFGEDGKAFQADLERMVSTHYALIIEKGFRVAINRAKVKPRLTRLIFTKQPRKTPAGAIRPFIFKTKTDEGVDVFLTVGFTRPIPSADEATSEQEETKYSSLDAGWTVVCNERAVLYCDRTELTGWGEAGVPRYHNQFIAISGIVEFSASNPALLPTTTTKRGIDASSALYLQVKNKMHDGMRLFTDYTNKWKGRADDSRKQIEAGTPLSFEELKAAAEQLPFTSTKRSVPPGKQYRPSLPMPKEQEDHTRRISFARPLEEVRSLGAYLFEDEDADPSSIGAECFDLILREAQK